jgi:hypothetical protein
MVAGMLYANVLSPATRTHVMTKSSMRPVPGNPSADLVSAPARADDEQMNEAIEELKGLHEKA